MTNLQLFIAIIVPMLFNGALIALVKQQRERALFEHGNALQRHGWPL